MWFCQCDCGNYRLINGSDLRGGKQISCGCKKRERIIQQNKNNFKDLTNQRFGKLTVLYALDKRAELSGSYVWHCKCDCGNELDVIGSRLVRGHTTSCGCSYIRRKSQYSEKIKKILIENNIQFQEEYLVHYNDNENHFGFFDFYLLDYNTCLEVQGQQHYDINHCWYRPEYDERKREYCNKNGIKLIEIPYYDYKNFSFDYLKQKMEN